VAQLKNSKHHHPVLVEAESKQWHRVESSSKSQLTQLKKTAKQPSPRR
jgi:hypothetical protein